MPELHTAPALSRFAAFFANVFVDATQSIWPKATNYAAHSILIKRQVKLIIMSKKPTDRCLYN